jgi:hypothetical protein
MDAQKPVDSPTVHAHKRQFAWQVLVPFLVVTALIIVVGVLVATGAASTTRTWADVATIWLITPTLIFAVFFIALLGFLIYGVTRLLQVMPRYTSMTQDFFARISSWTRGFGNGVVKPILWVQQASAILKSIFNL